MRCKNSKFEVILASAGNKLSNLCRNQNQASLTQEHSQNMWTLSWTTLQLVQLGEAVIRKRWTRSLLATILWMIMNMMSLLYMSNTGFCRRIHTGFQSKSYLKGSLSHLFFLPRICWKDRRPLGVFNFNRLCLSKLIFKITGLNGAIFTSKISTDQKYGESPPNY